jgi:Fe-S-cluster containining protein
MGYYDVYFTVDYEGLKRMRKLDGKCIFFQQGVCEIYHRRPKRCQFYPMTYDGDRNCAAVADECRFKGMYEITFSGNKDVVAYIKQLQSEYDQRHSHGNKALRR